MAISTTYFASLWPGAALEFQMGYQGRRRRWEGAYFAAPCGSASTVEPFPRHRTVLGKEEGVPFRRSCAEFGTSYAALTMEVAFAETILHQNGQFSGDTWLVDEATVLARYIIGFQRPKKPLLELVNLTGAYLKSLGLNNDLCSSDDYTGSMAVSAEVHDQLPHVDGIIYVSRQMNTGRAIVLFERSGLQRSSAVTPLKNHATIGALLTKLNVAMFRRGKPTGAPH